MAAPSAAAKSETRTWVLQAETELRFDVSSEHTLTVVVRYFATLFLKEALKCIKHQYLRYVQHRNQRTPMRLCAIYGN